MKSKVKENLIVKFITKNITTDELDELSEWILNSENEKIFKEFVRTNYAIDFNMLQFNAEKIKIKLLNKIKEESSKNKVFKIKSYYKYIAAAVIVTLLILPFAIKNNLKASDKEFVETQLHPGTDRAILTLENGEHLVLEKGKNQTLKNGKSSGEKIIYNKTSITKPINKDRIAYNYLTIPRGAQFFLELSDGTKVWLNSDSKIKYPVSFIKNQSREVELIYGEAYFDVSHSSNHNGATFNVHTITQDIEVLGTEFNIKAYQDENFVFTTLLKGKISVDNGIVNKILMPGEQSIVNINNEKIKTLKVDVSYEVSWKQGFFMFDKEPLELMMKTLSRWYDVEIIFEEKSKRNLLFSGILKRTNSIKELLENIEKTEEVTFEIKNKIIRIK